MIDLEALDNFVCDNAELQDLERRVGRFNLFDALKIGDREIRHSNFLAWLLDPAESHGRGDRYLKAVLMDLFRRSPADRPLSPAQVEAGALAGVDVRRESSHIDLLIVCRGLRFVVAVENKIGGSDGRNQLDKYEGVVGREFPASDGWRHSFVYLTPDGSPPQHGDWPTYSYADLHAVLSRVHAQDTADVADDVSRFVGHYLHLVGTKIMDDTGLQELCRTIYKTHRQAIDLIVKHGMDRPANLVSLTAEWVRKDDRYYFIGESANEVVFVPACWFDAVPPIAAPLGSKQRPPEALLLVVLKNVNDICYLRVLVAPSTDEELRKSVIQTIGGKSGGFGFKRVKNPRPGRTRLLTEKVADYGAEDFDAEAAMELVKRRVTRLVEVNAAGLPDVLRTFRDRYDVAVATHTPIVEPEHNPV